MKKTFIFSAISGLLLLSVTGCQKILDNATEQTVTTDYSNFEFTVNPAAAGTYSESQEVVTPNLDSILQYEGYDQGNVKSIKISDALIEAVNGGNLDPFSSFQVFLETSGKSTVTVAEVTSVPTGITEIALVKKGVNLSDYLKSYHYTIRVKSGLDQNLETTMNLKAMVKYEIKVGI